jgi:hypothetical protein
MYIEYILHRIYIDTYINICIVYLYIIYKSIYYIYRHTQANPTVMVIQQWSKQSFHPHHPGCLRHPPLDFFFFKFIGKMLNFSVKKRDYLLTS